ncbi:HD-GYP domain-containing protein [Ruminococcus sp. NK3A76]|uniref:HD-GYP domain-containing protein n=1 Tax=Ruminococcus sp. NK3A76 TaxID=877411 RepID=UPI00068AF163|nr:HD-GYP domain-containing protein [Ruminococcus sp. NK3A76]
MKEKKKPADSLIKLNSVRKDLSRLSILVPLVMYFVLTICTAFTVQSGKMIVIGDATMPMQSFAGVFTSLANIWLVVMVIYYKKPGFVLSMLFLLLNFVMLVFGIFVQKNLMNFTGVFTSVFTIMMLIILRLNQVKNDKEHKRVQSLFEQTATALVNAIDAKDKYTHGHSTRVAEYSRKLAELNGKSDEECEEIYYAALLHDVGKIGIPESIINKDGELTPEEYEIIKQHPVLGEQILKSISEFPYLSIGACAHHERYDGKGYPYGLKGTDIPEIARIVSVADAYDTMSSKRSYRDPIPQQIVREEIVKGIGEQFDPVYARLMLHLIDIDTEYEMREREEVRALSGKNELTVGKYRSEVSNGLLITPYMSTVYLTVTPSNKLPGRSPVASLILFDSLDGRVHETQKQIDELNYFEYGEVWLDGRTAVTGARKMHTSTADTGDSSLTKPNEYKIEAVKYKDHALINIKTQTQTHEVIIALSDSTRYLYIALTGEHCRISDVRTEKANVKTDELFIPRIAEKISYINEPAGDIPNVQVDGYRTESSLGVEIKDGLTLSFHARSLPTARLVWHCPFIDLFCADDGMVGGKNYRDLAFMRFDGEFWESDKACKTELNVIKKESFGGWEAWKEYNSQGFDTTVTFKVNGSRIQIITENAGILIKSTAVMSGIDKKIYAALTGDQVAITGINISLPETAESTDKAAE